MLLVEWLGAIVARLRRDAPMMAEPLQQSLPTLASAALKPGTKTWLVARAVSLRAF